MNRKLFISAVIALAAISSLLSYAEHSKRSPDPVPTGSFARADKPVSAAIAAGTSSVSVSLPEGSSVFDAMSAASSSLSFKARLYPDLGYFIEEIGGVRNGDKYWTLYVNGAYSQTGASQTVVRDGDRIEWRYEKL